MIGSGSRTEMDSGISSGSGFVVGAGSESAVGSGT